MNSEVKQRVVPESERNSVVAVYAHHTAADGAVIALEAGGVDPRRVAVIGHGPQVEGRVIGFYSNGHEVRHLTGYDELWGGPWDWVVFGVFWVPGLGHVIAAGWIVWNLASTAGNRAIDGGLGAVAAALMAIGIPEEAIAEYESTLKSDCYLVIVHGTPEEVEHARSILDETKWTRMDARIKAPLTT